ncbi:hypothetical protein A2Z33_04185 [Candidatus Gottesmanbacteria bacterium RBG_16_52_11]|uniref:Methyltransferase type 11 domain-containing protein n=1 Tax=Candidatus Gottesmanbacteria bacterium RBG_16_52_11 TaxID=1798374 RepID=A0A1F5YVU3_9BACT|nr:MAG: hypothetical protein A2Z33_04185 [Candidatus Gottesmanbacteria bacterium RBG_16_52_11]
MQAADSVLPTNPGGFARLVKHHRIPTLLVYNSQSSDSRTLIPAGLTGPSGIRRLRVNVIGNQPPVSSGSGKRRRADIRVAYFPNPSETERKRLLRESWAFVPYGSDSEEVWLAAEAAGYGVPVVSRDGTDLGGLITHDVNGLIAGPDNAAAGIRSVLTDGELRQRLSREAAAISRRNSIRHISRRVLRQISSAVRSRGSSQLGFRIIHTRPHYRPLDRMRAWYIKSVLSPQSLLDVGCGDGEFVSLLRGSGLAAWGIDTSRYMLSRSPARIRPYVRTGNIMSMDVADRSYDAVSCIDVLEHIPEKNIDRAIAECARVARWSIFFDITTLEDRAFVHADPTHVTKLHAQDWMQRIVSALKNDWSVRRPFMFPFVMNGLIIAQRKPVT